MRRFIVFIVSFFGILSCFANASNTNTYAVLVGGINKDPDQIFEKSQNITLFRNYLRKDCGIKDAHIYTLADKDSYVQKATSESCFDNLSITLKNIAEKADPNDTFIFYYTGQANIVDKELRINLPGKDITAGELAQMLNSINTANSLVIIDCPGSGLIVEPLKISRKIVICSARADQQTSTRLSNFLIPAMKDREADFDQDGRISVLESFQLACFRLDELFRDKDLLLTETPLLEDDGDGVPSQQPWRYETLMKDGQRAANFFLMQE